jgi:hypothetical protein
MTIDERIEALTMNLELMSHQIEEHSKQLSADGEHIRALARIAEIRERRLTHLEDAGNR